MKLSVWGNDATSWRNTLICGWFCSLRDRFACQSYLEFLGWSSTSVLEYDRDLPWFSFRTRQHFAYCDPSPLFQMRAFVGFNDGILSSFGSFLRGIRGSNRVESYYRREPGVEEENKSAAHFDPKFYRLTSSLFFVFGLILFGLGRWNTDHGDWPINKVLVIMAIGGCMVTTFIVVFGVYCRQNA